jgi:LysM repeat protein
MRLRLVIAALAAAALLAPVAGASSGANPQTAGLQVALRAQGLYHGAIDAIAGRQTVAAVRAFQRIHHLPVTGLADARTRRELGPLGRHLFGSRMLRHGDFGWDVAVLQFLLVRRGISVPINAYFDRPTRHGVRVLQRRLHVRADGVVGPHTLTAIVRHGSVPVAPTHLVARHTHIHHRLRTHVVRKGETLSGIARRYGTTVRRLARLNHLDPSHYLLIGTKLRIPAARRHVAVVRTAERISSVAPVRTLLDHWAAHYGVNRHLVRALAWMESGYNNSLVSPAGARGIMQILPSTWSYVEAVLIRHRVRHDANGNIRIGVAYIHHLLRDFHGNQRLALAGWYQGEGAVRQRGVYKVSRHFAADVIALEHRM